MEPPPWWLEFVELFYKSLVRLGDFPKQFFGFDYGFRWTVPRNLSMSGAMGGCGAQALWFVSHFEAAC